MASVREPWFSPSLADALERVIGHVEQMYRPTSLIEAQAWWQIRDAARDELSKRSAWWFVPLIHDFAGQMAEEMAANLHKDSHPLSSDPSHLLEQLREHVEKLAASASREHAADVANLAMLYEHANSHPRARRG